MGVDPTPIVASMGPNFSAFWTYWNTLPKYDLVPHLSEYLDSVPPDLQPKVVLLDVSSPTDVTVRLTGTVVAEFVGELTGTKVEDVYQGKAREMAIKCAWISATHPCGYVVTRTVSSKGGLMFNSQALILPLKTDTPGSKTVVSFNERPPLDDKKDTHDHVEAVIKYPRPTWLDIGAGTPTQ
ncbi:MAG: PAS domain-containing protein [Alphaproteobacteria bacterium]|nr:PAS domain-containing protein [Alphaproteobacteria bacterium]